MLFLLRWFNFRQHDLAGAWADSELVSVKEHHYAHAHLPEQALGADALFVGSYAHKVFDGIALGAVLVGWAKGAPIAGVGVFLAILLHKPLDELSIETVMGARGCS